MTQKGIRHRSLLSRTTGCHDSSRSNRSIEQSVGCRPLDYDPRAQGQFNGTPNPPVEITLDSATLASPSMVQLAVVEKAQHVLGRRATVGYESVNIFMQDGAPMLNPNVVSTWSMVRRPAPDVAAHGATARHGGAARDGAARGEVRTRDRLDGWMTWVCAERSWGCTLSSTSGHSHLR